MATLVFDFDSTLIQVESLEKILAESLREKPEIMAAIEAITAKGMAGGCSFAESLQARLALAAPTRQDVAAFGQSAHELLTPGMADLIQNLLAKGVEIHIVSGGLIEAIWPVADFLGIPRDQVHAVRLQWHGDGTFASVDPEDPFSQSKIPGFRPHAARLTKPIIVIGDGMTDYQLYQTGLATHFVAFCQHVQRETVIAQATHIARDVNALATLLEQWL